LQVLLEASYLAASAWIVLHVFPPTVGVFAATLIPPGHTEHGSCAWAPVERMAATAKMENFITLLVGLFYVWCDYTFSVGPLSLNGAFFED